MIADVRGGWIAPTTTTAIARVEDPTATTAGGGGEK